MYTKVLCEHLNSRIILWCNQSISSVKYMKQPSDHVEVVPMTWNNKKECKHAKVERNKNVTLQYDSSKLKNKDIEGDVPAP